MSTTSRAEEIVEAVEAFYRAENARDIGAWREFWHPDATQTFWQASGRPPVEGRDLLVAEAEAKFRERPPYSIRVQADALGGEGQVLARLAIEFPDGSRAPADIWCIFHFDREGLITEVHEIVGVPE